MNFFISPRAFVKSSTAINIDIKSNIIWMKIIFSAPSRVSKIMCIDIVIASNNTVNGAILF